MTAAAAFALGLEASPPPLLRQALGCQRWNSLPAAGGYEDQSIALVQMEAALDCYNAFQTRERARAAGVSMVDFSKRNPRLVEFCDQVEDWLEAEA